MKTRTLLLLLTLSLGLLLGLFFNTNPDSLPIGLLILPIVILFLIGFFTTTLLLRLMRVFTGNSRKQHILAVIGGLIGVFWIIVQSAGGVTIGDVILLGIISVIAIFYITKY